MFPERSGVMSRELFYELRYRLCEYLKLYGKYYSTNELKYIRDHFFIPFIETNHFEANTLLLQVYEEMGVSDLLPFNFYANFIKHIARDCNINNDLLEVGCGVIPSLAKSLKKKQTNGSITVMDPMIRIENYGDLKIIKDKFNENTDVEKYSLIYGNFPCSATEKMICSSFKNDVDLYISLCGCAAEMYLDYQDYLKDLDELLFELSYQGDRSYEIIKYSDLKYPVIKTFK